ncbi:MAG TPA: glycosyltransferase family 2 protein [bacterium]|nr:glycosyltransferase family 2 protein [Candidatus Magasanikbacteria bacterium]MCA9389202.1 glycosyltransferase family 2 protein [Candidatus Magasanikbacteria bacterium]USN52705.1 MAG: glycosyltransferase family 2 protein [Candidatus Nomurabacteria bacterium]HPF95552.1 glycosyltransferase family 2 protein [bacterium]
MKVIAVIPAYFEGSRIAHVIHEVKPFVDEVVVVDDGSTDITTKTAKEAGAIVFRHAVNRGQGAALRTGTEAALRLGADCIIHLDADGQHDSAAIPLFLKEIEAGSEVVFGSRFLGAEAIGMPKHRRYVLALAKTFNRFALGISSQVTDPQSGYRAMTAQAARTIDFRQDRMAHCSEILRLVTRSSLRWKEIPTTVRYTEDTLAKGQKATDAFVIVWQLILGAFQR